LVLAEHVGRHAFPRAVTRKAVLDKKKSLGKAHQLSAVGTLSNQVENTTANLNRNANARAERPGIGFSGD